MASHAVGLVAAQRSQFRAHLRRKHARLDVVGQRWGRTGLGRGRVVPQAVGAAGGTPVGTRRRAFPPAATGLAVGGSAAWSVGTGAVAVVPVAGRLRVAGRALQVALAAGSRCFAVFGRLRRLPAVPERTLFAFRAAWPTTRSATWTRRAPLALLRAWSVATRVCSPTFPARSTGTGRVPRVTPAAAISLVRRAEPWRGGSRVLAAPAPFVRAARPPPVDWTPLRARTVLGTSPVAGATAALALPGALTVAAARGRRPIGAAGALVACRAVAAVAARGRPPATGAATPLVPAVAAARGRSPLAAIPGALCAVALAGANAPVVGTRAGIVGSAVPGTICAAVGRSGSERGTALTSPRARCAFIGTAGWRRAPRLGFAPVGRTVLTGTVSGPRHPTWATAGRTRRPPSGVSTGLVLAVRGLARRRPPTGGGVPAWRVRSAGTLGGAVGAAMGMCVRLTGPAGSRGAAGTPTGSTTIGVPAASPVRTSVHTRYVPSLLLKLCDYCMASNVMTGAPNHGSPCHGLCPAVSYSPTLSRGQYHRRWRA